MSRKKTALSADPASVKILQAALASPLGIELVFPTKGAAEARRFNIYHARKCDRRNNPPNYASQYDPLVVQLKPEGDHWALRVVHGMLDPNVVVRELGTMREININEMELNAVPSKFLHEPMPALGPAPPPMDLAVAERMALERVALQTNQEIELDIKNDPRQLPDDTKRAYWYADRAEARTKLGWCVECGSKTGHTPTCSANNNDPLGAMPTAEEPSQ